MPMQPVQPILLVLTMQLQLARLQLVWCQLVQRLLMLAAALRQAGKRREPCTTHT